MEFGDNGGAEFNSGLAIIYQLDAIEKELILTNLKDDYDYKYRVLLSYYKTLRPHITKDDERIHYDKHYFYMRDIIKNIRQNLSRGITKIDPTILDNFDYWEIMLRELKQKSGLGMKKSDPRFAMAGR